ncbi:MAG: hypothetical protein M3Y89_08405, partial [Actinomycetota bacterium]|nr:hypothetical protein [Actinomycetota bacterium]
LSAGYALAVVLAALAWASWIRQPIWKPAARSVLGGALLLDVLVLSLSSVGGVGRALDAHGWLWQRPVQHLLTGGHPVWPMLTLLAVTSVAGLARRALLATRTDPARWIVATTALVAVALSMNARPDVLLATAGWLAVAIGTALLAGRLTDSTLLAVPAVALVLAELTAVASDLSSIAAFGSGALLSVLIGWRFAERAVDRTVLELAAIGQLFVAVAAGIHHGWPADGTPAVGGLLVCAAVFAVAAVLSPQRRWWQWLAFSAVTVAIWIEAVLHDVHAAELYSVPAGVIVLAFGIRAAQRDRQLASWLAYGPGLLLLTGPSLVLGMQQPLSWRTTAVGVLALVMVLAGSRLRLQAPLLIGAAELTVVVLWELGPYALAIPRWAVIAAIGVLLLAIGITWENRLGNLRRAHQQLAGMR